MSLSPQAWTAVWAVFAFVAVLAACCFGPPAWEAMRAGQYRRESARLGAAQATIEPAAPAVPRRRSPFARLRARNERILRDREERANHG